MVTETFDPKSVLRIDLQLLEQAKHVKDISNNIAIRVQHPANETSFIITNLDASASNTEVSHVIAEGVRSLYFKPRRDSIMQFAFVITESGTKFITVPSGQGFTLDTTRIHGTTIFIQTDKANNTIDILESI